MVETKIVNISKSQNMDMKLCYS